MGGTYWEVMVFCLSKLQLVNLTLIVQDETAVSCTSCFKKCGFYLWKI